MTVWHKLESIDTNRWLAWLQGNHLLMANCAKPINTLPSYVA